MRTSSLAAPVPGFAALILAAGLAAPARADTPEDLQVLRETTFGVLEGLVEQGLLTREKADEIVRNAQKRAAARARPATPPAAPTAAADDKDVMRIPYVPEIVRRDIEERLRQQVLAQAKAERWGDPGAYPAWLNRITWEGDVRLRYQLDRFPDDAVPNVPAAIAQQNGIDIENTSQSRERLRVRFRFGLTAAVNEKTTAGLRLASGTNGDGPELIAGNQTLGNYSGRFLVGIDRAYLQYRPAGAFTFSGGRIANPFYAPTDLVWYGALSLDGIVARYAPSQDPERGAFATVGFFPVQDVRPSPLTRANSKYMLGYQAGYAGRYAADRGYQVSVGFFDYRNVEGRLNPTLVSEEFDDTAPVFRQKGNSVFDIDALKNQGNPNPAYLWGLASKFRMLNLSGSADLAQFGETAVTLAGDYVRNLGFDRGEIRQRTGLDIEPRTTGYQTRLTVGQRELSRKGAWQAFLGYRYLQRDATLDAFTDTEFRLGGSDAKGYFIGTWYALERDTQLGLRWMSAKQIDGLPLAIDVLQADMLARF